MLTKIKNPASGEMQKETPAQIQKNKKQNEQRQRIKQLQNVLKVRAQLKDRLSWYGEADAEEEKQETQEEIGRLEERLAHLEKELVELNWDRQDAIEEQSRLFDLILNTPGEVDPKIDAEYSKVSKKLGDMWELKGKIENAILETKERLDMENTRHWLVGREDEELQDIREIALRVIKDPDFSTPAVLDAIVTYRVANQMLGEEEMPEDLSKVSPTVKYI